MSGTYESPCRGSHRPRQVRAQGRPGASATEPAGGTEPPWGGSLEGGIMRYRRAAAGQGMSEQSDTQSGPEEGEAAAGSRSAGSERSRQTPAPPQRAVVLRYGRMGHLGVFRHDLERPPAPGTTVVARTHRGAELVLAAGDPRRGQALPLRMVGFFVDNV